MLSLIFLKVNKKSAYSRVQTKPIKHHSENQVVEISDERCQVLRKKASIKSSLIRKTSELQNKENSQIEFKGVWYLPNWNTGLKLWLWIRTIAHFYKWGWEKWVIRCQSQTPYFSLSSADYKAGSIMGGGPNWSCRRRMVCSPGHSCF